MGDLGSGEDGISPIPCGSGRKLGVNVEDHGSSLQTLVDSVGEQTAVSGKGR